MNVYGYTKVKLSEKEYVNLSTDIETYVFSTEEERNQELILDYNSEINEYEDEDEEKIEEVTKDYYDIDRYSTEIIFQCFEEELY